MPETKEVELISVIMTLESLNKKFQEITLMTCEAIYRILPDDGVIQSPQKDKDSEKSYGGHIGEMRKQINVLNETVDRCAYNLSRLQKIA